MTPDAIADTVWHQDEAQVRTIVINRPDRKNALDVPMRAKIVELAMGGHRDPDIRAMIVTGAGGAFCSGADVNGMHRYTDLTAAQARVETAQAVARSIAAGPTPVIAAVEGIAFGAGLGIALACDYIVAAADARFSAAFTNVGLSADAGTLFTLPNRVGSGRARRMLLLGEPVLAESALQIGLVDELTAPGGAAERALAVANTLACKPPLALAALKTAFGDLPTGLADALELETALQAPLLLSADFAEAVAGFQAGRSPRFTGT